MEHKFELAPRIGTFFIIIGFGLFVLFLGSEFSHQANFNYFFLGLVFTGIGLLFRRRATRYESGRFASVQRARERSRKRREERRTKQQKGRAERR